METDRWAELIHKLFICTISLIQGTYLVLFNAERINRGKWQS